MAFVVFPYDNRHSASTITSRWHSMSMIRFLLIMVIGTTVGFAQQLDTLRYHVEGGGYVYYRDTAITMQAARFELGAPAYLHTVVVTLGGPSANGTATLHIYGHEGGLPAPGLEQDLIAPITIRKTHTGAERCTIELPSPLRLSSHQVFAALDRMDPGVLLLSDRVKKRPTCVASDDSFTFQALRGENGAWRWGEYAFAMEAIVEYDLPNSSHHRLRNVTDEVHLTDGGSRARSIAWADINRDGYVDLLVGGRLYRNMGGKGFEDITQRSGLSGDALASAFIDINGDGIIDFLTVGEVVGGDTLTALYIGEQDRGFVRHVLAMPVPENPTSISIADANDDGYPDVFIGGGTGGPSSRLYLSDGRENFIDGRALVQGDEGIGFCYGSQWVDGDEDGDLDLFVVGDPIAGNRFWLRQANGLFTPAPNTGWPAARGGYAGCHWFDFDNDGHADLLSPLRQSPREARADGGMHPPLLRRVADAGYLAVEHKGEPVTYEEQRGGGAWGDINNDGLVDFILTTSCDCRYVGVYGQEPGGGFTEKTYEWGMARVSAGSDAMWVDYDNDGRLDLATFVNGRVSLWRNELAGPNNYVGLELQGAHAIGAEATLWVHGHKYTQAMSSGRGLLMQEPLRLHFGLGPERSVDSATVRWSNGRTEVYRDLAINTLHKIREGTTGGAASMMATQIVAEPNPFSTLVTIGYTLSSSQNIRLGIYTAGGIPVRTLVDEVQHAGEWSATWNAEDDKGEKVAQGTYIYRLTAGGHETSGKIVLIR